MRVIHLSDLPALLYELLLLREQQKPDGLFGLLGRYLFDENYNLQLKREIAITNGTFNVSAETI